MEKHRKWLRPMLTAMKASFYQLFITCVFAGMVVAGPADAQELLSQKISLNVSNEEIKSVLKLLNKEANVRFTYSSSIFRPDLKISLKADSKPLAVVLDAIFEPLLVKYEIKGRQVILRKIGPAEKEEIDNPVKEPLLMQTDRRIQGTVRDSKGEVIPGVNIILKGTAKGSVTSATGEFNMDVPADNFNSAVLVFSFVGYQTLEIPLNNRDNLSVILQVDPQNLSEVVVVGYGTQKKVNLTGSVVTVDSKSIENRGGSNVSNLLAGLTPGLTILQRGGNPGRDGGSLNVRGIGTLGNANPLILVDGIETGTLDEINPGDVASVTILKDAAASSIYGIRAANGVILVTTKKGEDGKAKVTYDGQFGGSSFTRLPAKVNSFDLATLYNEGLRNDGSPLRFTDEDLRKFADGSSPLTHANTNQVKEVLSRPGLWNSHNLAVAGGNKNGHYNVSLGYLDQGGIMIQTGSKRYTLRVNLDKNVTDKFNIALNTSFVSRNIQEPAVGINWVMHTTFREWANDALRYPDGRYADPIWSGMSHNSLSLASPDMGNSTSVSNRLIATLSAQYQLAKGLSLKGIFSTLNDFNKSTSLIKGIDLFKINPITGTIQDTPSSGTSFNPTSSSISKSFLTNSDLNTQLFLNYEGLFGNHYLKGLLGFQQRKIVTETAGLDRNKLADPILDQINAGDPTQGHNSGNTSDYRSRSGFGRVNYIYADKYLFEANARYDGTSRFASDRRFHLFPSVSAGWRISRETFFDVPSINELKVRGSWGKLGNEEIGNYAFLNTYALNSSYVLNNQKVLGINEGTLANGEITWETTTSKNIGLDLGLFQGKLNLTADYFVKNTDHILLGSLPAPAVLGTTPPVQNAGAVRNKGFEITMGYRNEYRKIKYYLNGNLARVKNEITDLAGTGQPGRAVGDPIQNLYGYVSDGIFQNQGEIDSHANQSALGGKPKPGDLKYQDLNGDNIINANDRTNLGSPFPKITYGFSAGASFKSFDFGMVWQGVAAVHTLLEGRLSQPFWLSGASPFTNQLDRWQSEGDQTRFPRMSFNAPYNYVASSYWIENTSYLKLRNIQLGYTIPLVITKRLNISRARIYVSGENLLIISPFKNSFDPESVTSGDPLFFGKGTNTYPPTKRYLVGLSVTF